MSDDLHDLPQKGLPTVLNLLLKQLLNNNDINSWSIYENKVGIINLNIRFSVQVDDNAASQCIVDMPATYRKVGQKQVDRSRARAQQYNKTLAMSPRQTRSKARPHPTMDSIEHTRKYSDSLQDISDTNISVFSVEHDSLEHTPTCKLKLSSSTPGQFMSTENNIKSVSNVSLSTQTELENTLDTEVQTDFLKVDKSVSTCNVFLCSFCHKQVNDIEKGSLMKCAYQGSCSNVVRCDKCRIQQTTHGQSYYHYFQ